MKEGKTPKEPKWGETEGNPAVTGQALVAEHKEPG